MNGERKDPRSDALEWLEILIGPIAWLTQFLINYVLMRWECIHHTKTGLHVVHLLFGLVVICGGIVSVIYSAKTREKFAESEKLSARPHFMAMLGIFSSALFTLAIIMQAIPSFILNPCDK